MYSVLFVCRQNRYRSPIAMALLRQQVKDTPDEAEWLIDSAGTWTDEGKPPLPGVIAEMTRRGIDLSKHRARTVNREMINDYHLIITVDKDQHEALCLEFRDAARRIHLLTEMANERGDVSDMEGDNLALFNEVADDIDDLLKRGFEKIKRLAKG